MSAIERGLVSLVRMEEQQQSDKLFIRLDLPQFVDKERIGFDLEKIHKLCKIAGINRIFLLGLKDQEVSQVMPNVVGHNPDGSAVASRSVARVDVPAFNSKTQESTGRTGSRVIDININANLDEIALRVAESKGGAWSAAEWARQLDNGLRHAVRRAGTSNLIRNRPYISFFSPDPAGIVGPSGIILGALSDNPNEFAIAIHTLSYGLSRLGSKIMTFNNPDHRFSFFPGPQIDRALWLNLVAATGKLVRDIQPDATFAKKRN